MSPIRSSLGSGRAKGLASGSACGGCRAGICCGVLRHRSDHRPPLHLCYRSLYLRLFVRFPALLRGCRSRYDGRVGEPLATAPGARCKGRARPENHAALGLLFLRVRVRLFHVLGYGLVRGASGIVDGPGWNPGLGFPGCDPRGRSDSGPSASGDTVRWIGDILCLAAHLLLGPRLLAQPLYPDGRGRLLLDRRSGHRGVSTPRLMHDLTLPIGAVRRVLW